MSHASYSQVSQWLRCQKSYQLGRIQQAPQFPTVWSFAGKALHSAIEQVAHDYHRRKNTDG